MQPISYGLWLTILSSNIYNVQYILVYFLLIQFITTKKKYVFLVTHTYHDFVSTNLLNYFSLLVEWLARKHRDPFISTLVVNSKLSFAMFILTIYIPKTIRVLDHAFLTIFNKQSAIFHQICMLLALPIRTQVHLQNMSTYVLIGLSSKNNLILAPWFPTFCYCLHICTIPFWNLFSR